MAPMKLIFRRDDMRLLGVHVVGEQATELVYLGLIAMMAEAGADLFNRTVSNIQRWATSISTRLMRRC